MSLNKKTIKPENSQVLPFFGGSKMSSHYFTNDEKKNNKIHNITYYYKEHLLSLTSSDGIFFQKP